MECEHEDCVGQSRVYASVAAYREHLSTAHHVTAILDSCQLTFTCEEDMMAWKREQERKSTACFVARRGGQATLGGMTASYYCHRSGTFTGTQGTGKRQLKSQGSCRSGKHCTACMAVIEHKGTYTVTYFPTHYGHEKLLGHLHVQSPERLQIAGQLTQGIPPARILLDIRSSVTGSVERIHLATHQDIKNVKRSFGISGTGDSGIVQTKLSDAVSVHAWVESCLENGDDSPVLLYKQQGTEMAGLKKDDFVLVLMTPLQKMMMNKFGHRCICIDSTHGMTGHDFELTSLLCVDEFREGFCVAFLFSSCTDTKTMSVFFECVKSAVGTVCCSVFMSDDAPAFYNAWAAIMGTVERRLLCTWHVDRAWKGKLNVIRDVEKRRAVYKALRTVHTELNVDKFTTSLSGLLDQLFSDVETKPFGEYFSSNYCSRIECWAYCHRKGCGINTNMRLENFHREMKYCYLEGKKTKRVDKCIEALFSFLKAKQFGRLAKLHKGKLSTRVVQSSRKHQIGLAMQDGCVRRSATQWDVTVNDKPYVVMAVQHECTSACVVVCRLCLRCVSAFSCMCCDYEIHGLMCSHIHAVCMCLQRETGSVAGLATPLLCETDRLRGCVEEINFHAVDMQKECKTVRSRDAEAIGKLAQEIQALSISSSDTSTDVLQGVIAHLKAAKRLLHVKCKKNLPQAYPRGATSQSSKQLLTPQKRFFSVRKKRKAKPKNLCKASASEEPVMRNILLGEELVVNRGELDHNYLLSEPVLCSNDVVGDTLCDGIVSVNSRRAEVALPGNVVTVCASVDNCVSVASGELHDIPVNAAMMLLRNQCPEVRGLQSPLLSWLTGPDSFAPQRDTLRLVVQTHHTGAGHWVTSTRSADGDCVLVYDSLLGADDSARRQLVLTRGLTDQLCRIYCCSTSSLLVLYADMQQQTNSVDCGLFAVAAATELCFGTDPCTRFYVPSLMRQHLANCLETNAMLPFPSRHRVPSNIYKHVESINVYCYCRKPVYDSVMVDCEHCRDSFHYECTDYRGEVFFCNACRRH